MGTSLQIHPRVAQWVIQALARLLATFALVQGVGIFLGGPQRWQSPGLAVAMMVPGAPATWGVILAVLGAITLLGTVKARHRLVANGLMGIATWCTFFTFSLLLTLLRDARVSTTGVPTYLFVTVTCCCVAIAYRQSVAYQRQLRRVT